MKGSDSKNYTNPIKRRIQMKMKPKKLTWELDLIKLIVLILAFYTYFFSVVVLFLNSSELGIFSILFFIGSTVCSSIVLAKFIKKKVRVKK